MNLARLYYHGYGVEKNQSKVDEYHQKVIKTGDKDAEKDFNNLINGTSNIFIFIALIILLIIFFRKQIFISFGSIVICLTIILVLYILFVIIQTKDKKLCHKMRRETFSSKIFKVLNKVHPDVGISHKAMMTMESFVNDTFESIAQTGDRLTNTNQPKNKNE